MKPKLFGLLLIILPVTFVIVLGINNMEYAWYFSENYRLYDLIKSATFMLTVMIGIALTFGRSASYLNFVMGISFVFIQTLAWSFDTHRYLSKVQLEGSGTVLLLVSQDAGALSSSSFANLDIVQRKYILFFKFNSIKSFEDVKSGTLLLNEDSSELNINLKLYSGNEKSIRYEVKALVSI
jgi:hypothetical protein